MFRCLAWRKPLLLGRYDRVLVFSKINYVLLEVTGFPAAGMLVFRSSGMMITVTTSTATHSSVSAGHQEYHAETKNYEPKILHEFHVPSLSL
jgi:hypothetical protein